MQSAATDCTDKVQALKGTTPDLPAWQMVIENATQQAHQKFIEQVNATGDSTINYINTLPPSTQPAVANVYSGGMSIVNSAINAVSSYLESISGSIKDFLAGIWDKITSVVSSVVEACTDAANALAGLFGLVTSANIATDDTNNQAHQDENSVGGLPEFTKPITKPANGSDTVARIGSPLGPI